MNNYQVFSDEYSCNFDLKINRTGSSSLKYDGRQDMFNNTTVIPLWVADMDFPAPAAVTKALSKRSTHPIYGYTLYPNSLYESLIDWLGKYHGWHNVDPDWIVMCPGVVPSLHACSIAFSEPNESIIVQPPVYFPFFSAITITGRNVLLNPLNIKNKKYAIDFNQLEELAKDARILFLCSPHNPVGRVWSEDELNKIIKISKDHNLIIFSDEIHADLVFSENKHKMLAVLADDHRNIVTAVAPSKTFNIPGLNLSALIIPDKKYRDLIKKAFETLNISASNPFSIVAFEAAYKEGRPWLLKLLSYLQDTRDFVEQYLRDYLPEILLIRPEATYLLWLDCRKLGMNDTELHNFFINKARVGMSPGTIFGKGGSGFMRMNIGAPRHIISAALENIKNAL